MQQPEFSSFWSVQKVLKQVKSIAADVHVCNTLWHNKGNPNGKKTTYGAKLYFQGKTLMEFDKSKKVDLHKEQQFKLS